jgi:1-acyl-sn-glycerol-3-phosphate acyltransferase
LNFIRLVLIVITTAILSTLSIILTPLNLWKGIGTYWAYKALGKSLLFICGVKLQIEIKGGIEKDKEYIIVSNHMSFLDIPVLMVSVPKNIRFIYKKSLTKIPIFGWSLYLGGLIPIDRKNARNAIESLKKAVTRFKRSISVVIFPEGTRSINGITADFKKGIFMLAELAEVDIIPVSIIGTNLVLRKDSFQINPGNVKVIIEEPIKFDKDKQLLNKIRDVIVTNINKNK